MESFRKYLEPVAFAFIAVICLFGVVVSRGEGDYFERVFAREDGFIEWLTVLALFVGAMACAVRAVTLVRVRSKWFIAMLCLASLVLLFGVGEEISWGQRLFGFSTPESMAKLNSQGETNLHNLQFGGVKINKLLFGKVLATGVIFYFFGLPFLYDKSAGWKRLVDQSAIPIPRLCHSIAYIVLVVLFLLVSSKKRGELLEFGGSGIAMLMLLFPLNSEIYRTAPATEENSVSPTET